MELNKAIKDQIAKNGIEVIKTKQFVNILDDLGAFKNEPTASKKVLKGLLDSGFADLVCRYHNRKDSSWQNSIRKCTSNYAVNSGYKDELIARLASILLYETGIITEIPDINKPSIKQDTYSTNVIKDPKELLYSLKQEYISSLSELLILGTDEFGHRFGFFSADANTKLYVIESKIKLVAKETGDTEIDSWLRNERQKIENRNRPSQAQIQQALNDVMKTLERDFRALMEKGVVIEDDEFGLKSARFTPNESSDLKSIENKILAIGNRLKENKQSWIDKSKSDFLISKSSPVSARNGVLDQLKNDYLQRLNQLDKDTKSGDINLSDSQLRETRRKLINLGSLLGKNMEQWCNVENERVAENRKARFSKRKKRNIIISTAAGIALLIGGGQTVSYTSSADARAHYEEVMASGDREFTKGNYIVALDLFQKAENDYNASYSSASYKNAAHEKAVEATDKIISEWKEQVTPLLDKNRVARAKTLTLALPANLVFSGNTEAEFKTLVSKIDEDLERRTATIIDEMLADVYAHQGKLSPSAKEELAEMIKVVPNNYWLNFIMDKAK